MGEKRHLKWPIKKIHKVIHKKYSASTSQLRPRATHAPPFPDGSDLATFLRILMKDGKPPDKPGSVHLPCGRRDSHSSRRAVADALKQPTRKRREPRHASLFGLAPDGVYRAVRRWPRTR